MTTLNFRQPESWYIEQSEYWSKRGDSFKSLLYARQACDRGGIAARLRLAAALYETGNFSHAARIYVRFLGEGHSTAEIYAGLIKCLVNMSRYRSAAFFARDARERDVFPKLRGGKIISRSELEKAVTDINRLHPDLARDFADAEDEEFKKLAYVIRHGNFDADETLLPDLYLGENDHTASEILFKAASVITADKLNKTLASKLLTACDDGLKNSDYPRPDILATRIIALIALGRVEEAEISAEDLLAVEMPDSDLDLLKCAVAMTEVGYHDGAVDYYEELTNNVFEENLVFQNAIANMNAGDKDRAKELFSEVLIVNPANVPAKYWCKLLTHSNATARYSYVLPDEEETKVRLQISEMLEAAGAEGGHVSEKREMRDLLAYELRADDVNYAAMIAKRMAVYGVYVGVLRDYLLDPEGRLSLKREILADMLFEDHKTPITAFLFGIKRIIVLRDFRGMAKDDGLIRAYVSALAAFAVYSEYYGRLDEIFDMLLPYLEGLDVHTIPKAENIAAALALYGGLDDAETPKDAAALFAAASTQGVDSLCREIEARYVELRRPRKKNSRKRRKE